MMKLTYIPAAYITHSKGKYNITIELPGAVLVCRSGMKGKVEMYDQNQGSFPQ